MDAPEPLPVQLAAVAAPVMPAITTTAPASTSGNLRQKANAAASATLAALLPHLAGNDTLLLGRSTALADDIGHLLGAGDHTLHPAQGSGVQRVLKAAMGLLGTPYRWGGASPDSGFDCSGLVNYVFRNALGIELPRVSREMATRTDAKLIRDRSRLAPGDLVFFGPRGRVNHVGIYVGNGRFLHAPSRGKDVRTDSLLGGYWGNRFLQARRIDL